MYDFLLLKFAENWTSSDGEHSDHPASFRSPDSPPLQPACWHASVQPFWCCQSEFVWHVTTQLWVYDNNSFFWLMWMIATLNYNSYLQSFQNLWGNISCKMTLCLDSCWNYWILSVKVCRTTVNVTLPFVHQINVVQPTMYRNNRK